jgi:hypothetical protein
MSAQQQASPAQMKFIGSGSASLGFTACWSSAARFPFQAAAPRFMARSGSRR